MALTKIDDRGLKTPIDLIDNEKIRLGTGNDLELYHDGTHSRIYNTTGWLKHRTASGYQWHNSDASELLLEANVDGAVELYYDGVKTFETHGKGITVRGPEGDDADILLNADEGDDNADKWRVRADSVASGFYIQNYESGSWEESIKAHGGGNVELYHNNSKKFETTSYGVYSAGMGQFDDGIKLIDNQVARFGAGNDLQIYHDGSNSFIPNTTGKLFLRSDTGIVLQDAGGNESFAEFNDNGTVELYYDGVKTFETTANGARIVAGEGNYAYLYIDSDEGDDNADKWRWEVGNSGAHILSNYASGSWETNIECNGNGNVELYYDGGKRLQTGAGGLDILGDEGEDCDVYIYADEGDDVADRWRLHVNAGSSTFRVDNQASGSWEKSIECTGDGAVDLHYNNSKKLETTSTGITVTGDINPTGHVYMDAGYGIAFDPYGGSGANLLDDYEEGNFTPVANDFDGTLTVNSATYTKVGRLVHIQGYLAFTNTTDSSAISLGGLPFQGLGAHTWNPITIQTSNTYAETEAGFPMLGRVAAPNSTTMYILGTHGDQSITYNEVKNGWIIFAGTYQTSA